MAELNELVTASEAAAALGVKRDTVNNWCKKGKFPGAFKGQGLTSPWYIPRSELVPKKPPGMTLDEAGKILGLEPKYLGNLCRQKKLPGVRQDNRWYVKRKDVMIYMKERHDRHDIDYEILRDPVALWACYEAHGFSFVKAAVACRCSKQTFRDYFYKAGLRPPSKKKRKQTKVDKLRGSGIPDVCPRSCPTYLDCLEEGSVCYFDPEQVPLDTTPL